MTSGNLFYASDKAIRDALLQQKFTKADLKDIFLSRGILVSNETKRDVLANYFCCLNHDYFDHQTIASILGVGTRKEKTSITNVKNSINKETLEGVIHQIRDEQQKHGDIAEIKATHKGFEIKLKYSQVDYNKSEFRQVVDKEAIVSIETDDDGVAIRWPLNDYVEDVKEKILDLLSKTTKHNESLDIEELELTNIEGADSRTGFFTQLIELMDGLSLYDVTDVHVYHPKESKDDETDNLGVHISKASLKGEGVLSSSELTSLYRKGFYIWRIIWIAKKNSFDSDLYEFEAQFADAELCRKFSYMVRGVYKYKHGGEYNKGKTSMPINEENKFSRLIESAAQNSLNKIQGTVEDDVSDENN